MGGIVVLEADELRVIVGEALAEALASHEPAPAPALLDRSGLARALGCSVSTVARLAKEGCPRVMLADAPRYELGAVLAWLHKRDGGADD